MVRFSLVVMLLLFSACAAQDPGDDSGGGGGSTTSVGLASRDHCDLYLSCLLIAAPQAYAAQLSLYGDTSECWKSSANADHCAQACDAAFGDIAKYCTCEGTTCQPATPATPTCADAYEPDDDINHAKPAPTATFSAAICPASDVDTFSITSNDETIVADATWTAGPSLTLHLLNAAGSLVGGAPSTTSGHARFEVHVPAGYYYVQITADKTDYQLTVSKHEGYP